MHIFQTVASRLTLTQVSNVKIVPCVVRFQTSLEMFLDSAKIVYLLTSNLAFVSNRVFQATAKKTVTRKRISSHSPYMRSHIR